MEDERLRNTPFGVIDFYKIYINLTKKSLLVRLFLFIKGVL